MRISGRNPKENRCDAVLLHIVILPSEGGEILSRFLDRFDGRAFDRAVLLDDDILRSGVDRGVEYDGEVLHAVSDGLETELVFSDKLDIGMLPSLLRIPVETQSEPEGRDKVILACSRG